MPLAKLEHVLILSKKPEQTRDFFIDILGMQVGYRPPFPFPGYWLYLGDVPCIHLAGSMGNADQSYYLDRDDVAKAGGTGAIDHIAFIASDLADTKERLKRHKLKSRERLVPEQGMIQLFIKDPNEITIELNFPAAAERLSSDKAARVVAAARTAAKRRAGSASATAPARRSRKVAARGKR
jgi:catechol 2,3-dioxygenase-like lactoylglutathione lyase family enzyme